MTRLLHTRRVATINSESFWKCRSRELAVFVLSDTPLSVLARDFEFGFVRLVLAHGEITMSSVVVVGARAVCFNWRAHEEEQRARVPARGQSLTDACGMRTQNWPIPWDVGVERHNRATTARTYMMR